MRLFVLLGLSVLLLAVTQAQDDGADAADAVDAPEEDEEDLGPDCPEDLEPLCPGINKDDYKYCKNMQRNNFQCFWDLTPVEAPDTVTGICCAKGNGWISWGLGPGPSSDSTFYIMSQTQEGKCTGHQQVTCAGSPDDDGAFTYNRPNAEWQTMEFTRPFVVAGEHTIVPDEEQVWHYGITDGSDEIENEHTGAYGGSRLIPMHPNPPSSLGGGGVGGLFEDVGTVMLVVAGGLGLAFVVAGGGVYYQKKQEQANLWSEHGSYSSYGGSSAGGSSWAGTNENPYSSSRSGRSGGSRSRSHGKRSHGSSHGKRSHGKRSHGGHSSRGHRR